MIEGQCACGRVCYQFDGEITEVSMCHCTQCRLAQGAAFVPVCPIDSNKLTINGAQYIKQFESSPGKVRAFCGNCGSPLYSEKSALPGIKRLRLGTVTTAFSCSNQYHKFVDSKADWHNITDSFPQYRSNNLE